MEIENLRNTEQLKRILIEMGLGSKIVEHKACNVLFDKLHTRLNVIEKGYVSKEDGKLVIKDYNSTQAVLVATETGLEFYICVTDKNKTKSDVYDFKCSLDENNRLNFKDVAGTSTMNYTAREQFNTAYIENRMFLENGLEIERESTLRNSKIDNRGELSTYSPHTYEGLPFEDSKITFRRISADVAYVVRYDKGEQKIGYSTISNEYGLQNMNFNAGMNNDYINGVEQISREDYERKIQEKNSPEIQEALEKYTYEYREEIVEKALSESDGMNL